jgi:phosphatidylserine decarboxylase
MLKKIIEITFIVLQLVLPKHLLSRLVAKAGETHITFIKNTLINLAIDAFNIDIEEAISPDPRDYKNFNDFFMRELKEGVRPINQEPHVIASPADGLISQCGKIEQDMLIQAKGKYFSLSDLLGGDPELAEKFINGHFATIYLSPRDYHRVHMANSGTLLKSIYIPGELFSVNQITADHIQGIFARNERLVNIFENQHGMSASIMVGAMLVAGIETVWSGQVVPPIKPMNSYEKNNSEDIKLEKGDEMGRFKFGSTVILLYPENTIQWHDHILEGSSLKMGEAIGSYLHEKS